MVKAIPKKFRDTPNLLHYPRFGKLKNFEVTEKVDGANLRFMRIDDEIVFGSRNVSPLNDNNMGGIDRNTPFSIYTQYVKDKIGNPMKLNKDYIYFAEAMMSHSVPYQHKETKVIGFAVYDLKEHKYIPNYRELFAEINIPVVRLYNFDEFMNYTDIAEEIEKMSGTKHVIDGKIVFDDDYTLISCVDDKTWVEGIVFSDYDNQVFYKYKTERYLEKAGRSFGGVKKKSSFNKFFKKYVTQARVNQVIDSMQIGDVGYDKTNPLPHVARLTIYDVFKEATIRDLFKTFGSQLMKETINAIVNDTDTMNKVMDLSDKNE